MTIFDNTEYQIVNLAYPKIKFICKGKRIDTNKWVTGYYLPRVDTEDIDSSQWGHYIIDSESLVEYEVNESSVCPYIGTIDVCGKQIFILDKILTVMGPGIVHYDACNSNYVVHMDSGQDITITNLIHFGDIEVISSILDDK